MKLDNEFTVRVPIEQAWAILTNLVLIAPCMPGAQLTGVNDGVYTGKVKVKVGPVSAEYAGTAHFSQKDDTTYRAVIDARGRDSRGQGNATAVISAQLRPDGDTTIVTVDTDLTIAGRIAQFGSGMIKEVSAKLLNQFVACLEGKLGGEVAGPTAAEQPTAPREAAPRDALPREAAPWEAPPQEAAAPARLLAAGLEPEPLNLMSVAARAVYKRLLPLVVAIVVVVAVIVYLSAK
ncbi:MAG: SRPBCC family protein [Streptosporangiaceae bacterium]